MKRKFFSLLALCGLLLFGCTNNPDNNYENEGDGDLVFDENGSIVYDNVQLKMYSVTTGNDAASQDAIISEFNTLYDGLINVKVEHISRYDLEQLLQSTMEFDREAAPDLLFNHGARTNEYVEREWIQPMDYSFEKAGVPIDKDDYVESLLNSTTINGKVYGIPQDVHSTMIVVRKDILEKNNLSIPTTYQELVNVCETAIELAKAGNLYIRGENSDGFAATEWRKATSVTQYEPFPIAFGDMWVHEFLGYTAAVQNGATFVDEEGYPGWNSKETIQGLQILRDFSYPSETSVNKYALSKDYGADYDVGNQPFVRGNAIFKLLGPWEYPDNLTEFDSLLRNDGGSSNITTISLSNLFALDSTKEYASKIKGEGHAIMLSSTVDSLTKKCAAAVFADYMAYNSGIEWAKRGHLPAVKSVENSSTYKSAPEYEAYIKNWGSCDDYVVYTPTQYYSNVDAYFKNALQKSMSGKFLDTLVKDILNEEYEDCVDYIDLYA